MMSLHQPNGSAQPNLTSLGSCYIVLHKGNRMSVAKLLQNLISFKHWREEIDSLLR